MDILFPFISSTTILASKYSMMDVDGMEMDASYSRMMKTILFRETLSLFLFFLFFFFFFSFSFSFSFAWWVMNGDGMMTYMISFDSSSTTNTSWKESFVPQLLYFYNLNSTHKSGLMLYKKLKGMISKVS